MNKTALKDLAQAVKAIDEWGNLTSRSRLDFHTQRAEVKMMEKCFNFVVRHHRKLEKLLKV